MKTIIGKNEGRRWKLTKSLNESDRSTTDVGKNRGNLVNGHYILRVASSGRHSSRPSVISSVSRYHDEQRGRKQIRDRFRERKR